MSASSFSNFDEHQNSLPRLPIPDLQATCDRLLAWSRPILSEEEYQVSERSVKLFLDDPTQGERLQKLLHEYDAKNAAMRHSGKGFGTYFEEFWNMAYLSPNSSVVLNLNPFFVLEDDPTPSHNSQIARASSLLFSSLKFISDLRRGVLSADMGRRNTPLCMSQFKYMFSTCRLAQSGQDIIETDHTATHIVVLCRGQFYYFDTLWPSGHVAVTEKDISQNFAAILEDANRDDAVRYAMNAVGVLTAESRDQWATCRGKLCELAPHNAEVLKIIDKALFIVCLDDCMPMSIDDRAANMLHGSYQLDHHAGAHEGLVQTGTLINRWYDKLQLIVCANGAAGINFEHSAVDGHTVLRFVSDIFADTIVKFASSITKGTHGNTYIKPVCGIGDFFRPAKGKDMALQNGATRGVDISPKKMSFILDNDLRKAIHYSETRISDQVLQNELRVLDFCDFGKLWIVSQSVSPDAFVQIAICTSYYILYGNFASQYESVMTKMYFHGRTEAGRSCTSEAKEFAEAWVDVAVSMPGELAATVGTRDGIDASTSGGHRWQDLQESQVQHLRVLFTKAWKAQVAMIRSCAKGGGVDRHMYGLKCQASRSGSKQLPDIFNCPAYRKLTNTIISTSNCGNPSLQLFGFGPVSPIGYGIGYIIKDNSIQFCITSKHRQTARYILTLQKFMRGMKELLHEEVQQSIEHFKSKASATSEDDSSNTTKAAVGAVVPEPVYDFFGVNSAENYVANQKKLASVGSSLEVGSSGGITGVSKSTLPLPHGAPFTGSGNALPADRVAPLVGQESDKKAPSVWSAERVVVRSASRKPTLSRSSDQMATLFGY